MTEVHRYKVVTMLSMAGATIGYDPHGPDVVMASDFDGSTRLFLDAAERCVASERREKELQQRLTAADERVDVLKSTLEECITEMFLALEDHAVRSAMTVVGRTRFLELVKAHHAALKPADATDDSCEFCKGWGFSSNSDGADEGCGACNGTGKEPVEGGGDE